VFAPLLMTFILTTGTGQAMTDRRRTASRPGYAARPRGFFPSPRNAGPGETAGGSGLPARDKARLNGGRKRCWFCTDDLAPHVG